MQKRRVFLVGGGGGRENRVEEVKEGGMRGINSKDCDKAVDILSKKLFCLVFSLRRPSLLCFANEILV